MEKPDANGFVNVTWPSKNIPHGGVFHTHITQPSVAQQQFLKVLLEESKLSIAQRQKSAWGLRQDDEKISRSRQVEMPVVRPRTSRRRSLSAIRESGIFDIEYRPLKRGEDREKMKEKLANMMAFGDFSEQKPPAPPRVAKPAPKLPTNKEKWNELITQIRERAEWLAEMEYLGEADPHREIVNDQIAERMRALDALGIDSECSSARSTASGFSTLRSREIIRTSARSSNENISKSVRSNPAVCQPKPSSIRSSAKNRVKEENVAAFNKFSPLQYSPSYSVFTSANIAVLILARGGSKGVRLKNLEIIGGVSLVKRAIDTAKKAGFDDISVSTDHPLIALEAIKCDAAVFHRSPVTATDWAPSIWGAAEFLAHRHDVEILILLQVTSPFTRPIQLRRAIEKLNHPIPFDCVFSVTRSYKLRWQYRKGTLYPLNFETSRRPRRQDWKGELLETGAFYLARKSLINKGYFQNNKTMTSPSDTVTFEDLEETDVISVDLVPERKGLILKHCEYYVSSRRHGTTVSRRYNEFVQLHDVLFAKYPYRAVCRLPPKRVVVGGGSPHFLQRRRSALQRWLTLVARHPVLAHDADLRVFLCETAARLDKPKHDEFVLAGTQQENSGDMSIDDMQAAFLTEQEQLRLLHLGLGRLSQIFEKVECRCENEKSDIRELGAGLNALSTPAAADSPRWIAVKEALGAAAELAVKRGESRSEDSEFIEEGPGDRVVLGLDALGAYRELCARLTRGLHAERAAAAAAAPHAPASQPLRARHRYALRCALEEARVARAYALAALELAPALARARGAAHARLAALWADLHTVLRHPHIKHAIQ